MKPRKGIKTLPLIVLVIVSYVVSARKPIMPDETASGAFLVVQPKDQDIYLQKRGLMGYRMRLYMPGGVNPVVTFFGVLPENYRDGDIIILK